MAYPVSDLALAKKPQKHLREYLREITSQSDLHLGFWSIVVSLPRWKLVKPGFIAFSSWIKVVWTPKKSDPIQSPISFCHKSYCWLYCFSCIHLYPYKWRLGFPRFRQNGHKINRNPWDASHRRYASLSSPQDTLSISVDDGGFTVVWILRITGSKLGSRGLTVLIRADQGWSCAMNSKTAGTVPWTCGDVQWFNQQHVCTLCILNYGVRT